MPKLRVLWRRFKYTYDGEFAFFFLNFNAIRQRIQLLDSRTNVTQTERVERMGIHFLSDVFLGVAVVAA